jgi:hypothetical protein
LLKVGVALGHSWATMSQELLHNVEADPAVNEVAGVAVTQIMQAHIRKARPLPDAVPRIVEALCGLVGSRAGE